MHRIFYFIFAKIIENNSEKFMLFVDNFSQKKKETMAICWIITHPSKTSSKYYGQIA